MTGDDLQDHEHDWDYYRHRDEGGWPILRDYVGPVRACRGCSVLQFKAPGDQLYGHDSHLGALAESVLAQWFEKPIEAQG